MTDLVLTVMLHSWQSRLLPVSLHPAVVSPVGLLDAPVVCDVLSLGVDSVEALVDRLSRVVAVLPDDALGLVQVILLCRPLPPVGKVPSRIKRTTLVVEAMGDLMSYNLINISLLHKI